MNSTAHAWICVMLLLCIGLAAAHISRSHRFKQELFRQQYLNDAVKQMELPPIEINPCYHVVCRDI